MLLHKSDSKHFADALNVPELHTELDRAVWQVEKSLRAEKELGEEKAHLDAVHQDSKKSE
jgi:hypothetical protein